MHFGDFSISPERLWHTKTHATWWILKNIHRIYVYIYISHLAILTTVTVKKLWEINNEALTVHHTTTQLVFCFIFPKKYNIHFFEMKAHKKKIKKIRESVSLTRKEK